MLLPRVAGAEPFNGRGLDQHAVGSVLAAALEAIAPRALLSVPIPRLALWAAGGLSAIDPSLQPDLRGGALRLTAPGIVLFTRLPPAPDDAAGWGEAVAQMVRAAWDSSDLVRAAGTQGIVGALLRELTAQLDPYSRYVPPAEAEAERAARAGAGGIGADLALREGRVRLVRLRPHGPAAIAGAAEGDAVLAIDGTPTEGEEVATLRTLLAGPEQSTVRLTLRRGAAPPRTLHVTRAVIVPPTVSAARRGDVLVLRLSGFAADTGSLLADALAEADAAAAPARPRGVVLDLRGNRGGLLAQAVAAAEVVLPDGVVATTEGRDPEAAHAFVAHGADLTARLPLVVLVDGRTASAAEVLAAALADQHRAVVVGSGTFGKGLAQLVLPLPDGGALFVSWSRVLAPLGWPLQGLGVVPQVCTSTGGAALARQLAALDQGRNLMGGALERARAARAPLDPSQAIAIRAACPAAEAAPGAPDADWPVAARLLHDRRAYDAALIGPPPPPPEAALSHAAR